MPIYHLTKLLLHGLAVLISLCVIIAGTIIIDAAYGYSKSVIWNHEAICTQAIKAPHFIYRANSTCRNIYERTTYDNHTRDNLRCLNYCSSLIEGSCIVNERTVHLCYNPKDPTEINDELRSTVEFILLVFAAIIIGLLILIGWLVYEVNVQLRARHNAKLKYQVKTDIEL